MLKIYHVKGTRGFRPIWFCEERGLPYEVKVIDFSPEFRSTLQWRALSPTGKVPVMTDGTLTMFESGAMVDYLAERYGGGAWCPTRVRRTAHSVGSGAGLGSPPSPAR